FLWSNSAVIQNLNGIVAGSYSVTATDANGCRANASANVTQPATQVSASISSTTTVSCFGLSNGTASVSASGGTPSYTYNWSSGTTAAVNNNLSAATYTVTITDNKGCTATANTALTQPSAAASVTTSGLPVKCRGGNNGSAIAASTGGTSPYSYSWNNGIT